MILQVSKYSINSKRCLYKKMKISSKPKSNRIKIDYNDNRAQNQIIAQTNHNIQVSSEPIILEKMIWIMINKTRLSKNIKKNKKGLSQITEETSKMIEADKEICQVISVKEKSLINQKSIKSKLMIKMNTLIQQKMKKVMKFQEKVRVKIEISLKIDLIIRSNQEEETIHQVKESTWIEETKARQNEITMNKKSIDNKTREIGQETYKNISKNNSGIKMI